LAEITTPTLWLHGADDPLSELEAASALASTRPAWTFLTRGGIGHLPHLEDPTWTARSITEWLDGRARPPHVGDPESRPSPQTGGEG